MGSRLYSVYRRIRYLRYLKKVRKRRKKQQKLEKIFEDKQFKSNLSRQKSSEKKQAREKLKREKREQQEERRLSKKIAREQHIKEKIADKRKVQQEKKERKQLWLDARKKGASQSKEEKEWEKIKRQQLKKEQKEEKQEIKKRLKEKALSDKYLEQKKSTLKKEEKEVRKKRIRQLRPYIIKRRKREFIRNLRSINKDSFIRLFRLMIRVVENRSERTLFLKITLNSLSLFVLSYLTLYIVGEMLTLYAAQTFDYNLILYYYKIYYNIDSDQWTADAVKILYSIKPISGLVLGTITMVIYSSLRNENSVFKLFFLWFSVHGIVMFFGSLLMGTLLNQGFGWVIAYLYYKDTGKMVFSIIAIFALVVGGASIARSFLMTGNTYFNFISRDNRKFLLLSQVLIPSILGTAIIALMKVPTEYYYTTSEEVIFEILKLSSIILLIIPILFSFSSMGSVFFDEDDRTSRFHWIYILLAFIVFFGYRLILSNGIVFSGFS